MFGCTARDGLLALDPCHQSHGNITNSLMENTLVLASIMGRIATIRAVLALTLTLSDGCLLVLRLVSSIPALDASVFLSISQSGILRNSASTPKILVLPSNHSLPDLLTRSPSFDPTPCYNASIPSA